ncbi:hypothetical protein Cgig2_013595 [Carnegiea gigantea]|uniref:Sulfurtransferase n=1 Tax=Carnegiea gigantea TaxID=171969 RepID=A0A9Q1KBR3_9CARY|nr:hypothetical protein Cgig2_013595 [Carnegiea gigantea]
MELPRNSRLPHMLPSEEAFAAAAVSALRIENKDGVVVYDGKGIFSAARVWWMFRVFGHDKVWVLDGGLPRWRASGYDVESSASSDTILKANAASDAIDKVYQDQQVGPITFQTKFQLHLVWTLDQVILTMSKICSDTFLSYTGGVRFFSVKRYAQCSLKLGRILRTKHSSWLMPAQKPGDSPTYNFQHRRFDGTASEPRKGIRDGHVPGSKCVPFSQGASCDRPAEPYMLLFRKGINLEQPIVTSCGTGVTACVLALGLHRLGKTDVAVYDGSWTEWGGKPDTPLKLLEDLHHL